MEQGKQPYVGKILAREAEEDRMMYVESLNSWTRNNNK